MTIMNYGLCFNCFHIKGNYTVCPYCGYVEGTQPNTLFQLKPGTILEKRYIIGETLGYGGFGITYRAYDTVLSIMVAIKEFYPAGLVSRAEGNTKVSIFSGSRSDDYKKMLGRFIEEARNMALFAKESDIVNVFAYFEGNGTAYIIMEYIEGILLKEYLKEHGRMQDKQACGYLRSLLTAIQKIHSKGIIHRDISPDNIFLTSSSQIKLFDFGAAKLQGSEDGKRLSVIVKTGYAPPEQYRSKGIQDNRVDLYAAGAVLYQMLTGERPMESLERLENDALARPSQLGISIQPHVEKAVMKALSLNPESRFDSAAEFLHALEAPEKKKVWKWR